MSTIPTAKEWLENQEKYGEELWGKMEEERIERDMRIYDFY